MGHRLSQPVASHQQAKCSRSMDLASKAPPMRSASRGPDRIVARGAQSRPPRPSSMARRWCPVATRADRLRRPRPARCAGRVVAPARARERLERAWAPVTTVPAAGSGRRHLLHAAPGVAALGDGARVGERPVAGHGEGDHGVRSEAEAGLGAVGRDGLRPGLGEAAGLAGGDQQAQPVPAVPVLVPAGDVDGSDEGGAEANGVSFSGGDHVFSYSSVYGILAAMQRIAATRRESKT